MAKCPVCKNVELHQSHFEDNLPVIECDSCGGAWLRANEYALWLKTQTPGTFNHLDSEEINNRFHIADSNKAVICPDCGHFLRKYKIGSKIDFHLDRCNNCNGVWLDHDEWQALRAADLHDEINQIFTKPWQKHVLNEITARKFESMYLAKFGQSDYAKIKEIRKWLQEKPNRNMLIAYLLDKDPYSV